MIFNKKGLTPYAKGLKNIQVKPLNKVIFYAIIRVSNFFGRLGNSMQHSLKGQRRGTGGDMTIIMGVKNALPKILRKLVLLMDFSGEMASS